MNRLLRPAGLFLFFLLPVLMGCGGSKEASASLSADATPRTTRTDFLQPSADGTLVYGNDFVSIDASNTSEGYLCICYQGPADKARVQLTIPDSTVYSYYLEPGSFETFPLSGGSGSYEAAVYEHAYDSKYALAFSQTLEAELSDEFKPFLYPNQYCRYTKDSEAVACGIKLSKSSVSDLDYVGQVYDYVIASISYDEELAKNIPTDYIPDIDATLDSGKGICFDYASLMTAMLRSQGIPTKLEVGYSGQAYHAWISVYLEEIGWVDNIISFDGKDWTLMDPTLAAGNDRESVKKYIGDGTHYTVKYHY